MFSENQRFWKMGVKSGQKGSKNDLKIELWALGGSIFEILGGFSKRQIFDAFSTGKKNEPKSDIWGPRGGKGKNNWRVGGYGGVGGA